MIDLRTSRRYAKALLGLAEQSGSLGAVEKDFHLLRDLLRRHQEISRLVLNPTIDESEKEDFLAKVLDRQVSPVMLHFLKLLTRKQRFVLIDTIREQYLQLHEEKMGIQRVEVITALPLTNDAQEKLRGVLKRKLKKEILLTAQTDAGMIGGMVIRFGGKEINRSFREHLQTLKQTLMA